MSWCEFERHPYLGIPGLKARPVRARLVAGQAGRRGPGARAGRPGQGPRSRGLATATADRPIDPPPAAGEFSEF